MSRKSWEKQVAKGSVGIDITPKGNYAIIFTDKNGRSILGKTSRQTTAIVFAKKYQKDLDSGKLLREDKSAWSDL